MDAACDSEYLKGNADVRLVTETTVCAQMLPAAATQDRLRDWSEDLRRRRS